MPSVGFLDLSYELRTRIYRTIANDAERIDEKRVSRRTSEAVDSAFFQNRDYFGLTQTCRLIRREFRPVYLKDRVISVHIRDADDYLETLFSYKPIETEGSIGLLLIRTEAENKDDYPRIITPHRRLDPLLRRLLSVPNLQFRFTENGGASMFNNVFVVHQAAWKLALQNQVKYVDVEEPSLWGMRLVLNPDAEQPWMQECSRAWMRMIHMPEESLEFFSALGFSLEFAHADMIFVRRATSTKMKDFARGMTSSHSWRAKKGRTNSGRLGSIADNASLHSNRPLLAGSARGSFSV